jgi:isoquinoline 1-oxidoreductase beta subunit
MRAVVARRSFLAALGLSAGGLALGFWRDAAADPRGGPPVPPRTSSPAAEASAPGLNPNVFVHVAGDGAVTVVCQRSEMGQGIRSTLPALIAGELGADLARVTIVQADGDEKYGDQNTDGSASIRKIYTDMRRAGATPRTMLVAAAARRWRVDPATCDARDHRVTHTPTGRSFAFGELVLEAAALPVPDPAQVQLRREPPRVDGPLVDGPAYVTGAARYGADVALPGMLVAVIARPPVVGGRAVGHDEAAALAVPGVRKVVALPAAAPPWAFQPLGGVAVLADDTWSALRGRAALRVQWDPGEHRGHASARQTDELSAALREPGAPLRRVGDVEAALAAAARVVDAEYHVPHLAHVPMEPPVALARVDADGCEVWAPTQHPQAARAELARVLELPEDRVTVHVTFLGGAFGRKSKCDFITEAALLARAAGVPVRVQWTREDDIRHDYFNTVSAQRLTAALAVDGTVTAWRHRTAFPPIDATFADVDAPGAGDLQQGVLDLALAVPNVAAEACQARARVRVGWLRSVYNIFHGFAIGGFFDELAAARGRDPRDNLLELIGPPRVATLAELGVPELENYGQPLDEHPVDAGRLRRVVERVAELARWDARAADGRTLGLAAHRSFLSYVAVVASVTADLAVDEVWLVADVGRVVHPDRVRAQMEGAVIFGMSLALHGGVTLKDGAVEQSNFHDLKIVRIGEAPRAIHVELVDSDRPPGGVGEPGVPPVAPAIANAVFARTGKRLRALPLDRRA